ncbi:MAG: NAD(+)/NADH kinase [Cyanobacteria bacterium REEB67]|nr:NAD(+)/NADH kinase [Cyanobacteria bacterium REEB67]
MAKQALVVYNPTAKSQNPDESWIARLVAELGHQDNYVTTLFPTTPETTVKDIIALLRPDLDLVVAAGGDGTIRSVLAALAEAKSAIPAALMPLGTGNVLARNLGIVDERFFADPLSRAFDPIATGVPVRIDMGMMNGHYFAGMAGAGPLSDAFMVPEREAKTNFKNLAYAKAMLETMAMPPIIFKVTAAGRTFKVEASGIFVANVEDLGLGKPCDIRLLTDGYLDLHVLNPKNFAEYVAIGFRFAAGHDDEKAPHYVLRVKDAIIEVVPKKGLRSRFQDAVNKIRSILEGRPVPESRSQFIKAMIDGEEVGTTPMRVTVMPHAVTVLVPAARVEESQEQDKLEHEKAQEERSKQSGEPEPVNAKAAAVEGQVVSDSRKSDYEPGEVTAFINIASTHDGEPTIAPR